MATAKKLATPKIISIEGSVFRIAHPDISGNTSTRLAGLIAAAGTSMIVYDNDNFADNDWMVVGNPGQSKTETCDVNGAVTRGTSITVTNNLDHSHSIDAPVTRILERGIQIYGAATDGGAGTLIASIDAKTASGKQLADAVMIQWDKPYTEYNLITTDTEYAYYYAKFTDGVTTSDASTYVLAAGLTYNTIEPLIDRALDYTNTNIEGKKFTREMMVDWSQDCQEAITQFTYQDPVTGRLQQKDWSFEVVEDTLTTVENENTYNLSDLANTTKYPNSNKSIISIRLGTEEPLNYYSIEDYDLNQRGRSRTDVSSIIAAGDVSISVDDTSDFEDSGSLYLGTEIITYTGKTATTFTGIPASGAGAITDAHSVDDAVWQGIAPGKPWYYTVFGGKVLLDKPVGSDHAGEKLKVRHFKALDRLTTVSSTTPVTFTNVFPIYLSSKIEQRQGNYEISNKYMEDFRRQVTSNAQADFIPVLDEYVYHNYPTDQRTYDTFNY